ncbi:MAG TPA: DUF6056 family protein [Ignavibacteria bacterium]|nr:DUF6056 family protein [Ignavibacteria bacterium]
MLKTYLKNFKPENLLIPLSIFSFLPFLILFYYLHPIADDYFFWDRINHTGFYTALKSLYINWSGRFFSHAELLLSPYIFRTLEGYKILTMLLMVLYFSALYLFVSEFTRKHLSRKEAFIISLSIFFLYLYKMNTVGQGFFWLTSVVVYHNSMIFLMLFFVSYYKLICSSSFISKILFTVISCFLTIAVCASNEVSMVFLCLILILFFILSLFRKTISISLIFILVCAILTVYIDMVSPGTIMRADAFAGNENFIFSFFSSFKELFYYLFKWIFLSPLIPVTFILLPVLLKFKKEILPVDTFFKVSPFYIFLFGGLLLYSGFFVAFYGQGKVPFGRTINIIYFQFLIIWFYIVISMLIHFSGKIKFLQDKTPKYFYVLSFIIILFYISKANNIKTAYTDVLFGDAKNFDNELSERYKTIYESPADSVIVKKITKIPASLFLYDISPDPENIQNKWYAKHFKKKSIQTQ